MINKKSHWLLVKLRFNFTCVFKFLVMYEVKKGFLVSFTKEGQSSILYFLKSCL